ncbi:hypothetical protein WJU23_02560 [Prosthecobacter sp. SYSU 5D2]|uniref:hypothetical protein n=1 Tax=Prosthecobacter sp. SYSU 5D2 TaxID=3134134 RepID=UPI0031FE6B2C
MRSLARSQTLICLVLLALGWAQVFGMSRGYVCDCTGGVEIIAFDHCHGPHGETCHDEEEPLHHHDDHDTDDDTHEHTPLKESVKAKQLAAQMASFPAPILAVLAILEPLTMLLAVNDQDATPLPPPRDDGSGRRWPHVLTRTISLRV